MTFFNTNIMDAQASKTSKSAHKHAKTNTARSFIIAKYKSNQINQLTFVGTPRLLPIVARTQRSLLLQLVNHLVHILLQIQHVPVTLNVQYRRDSVQLLLRPSHRRNHQLIVVVVFVIPQALVQIQLARLLRLADRFLGLSRSARRRFDNVHDGRRERSVDDVRQGRGLRDDLVLAAGRDRVGRFDAQIVVGGGLRERRRRCYRQFGWWHWGLAMVHGSGGKSDD
uniref:(northern house mosquito) hypothetical protein n=1 Tax=Culex pipiens TaxID=7175 RepID=A0A8D8JGJ0_CULPI